VAIVPAAARPAEPTIAALPLALDDLAVRRNDDLVAMAIRLVGGAPLGVAVAPQLEPELFRFARRHRRTDRDIAFELRGPSGKLKSAGLHAGLLAAHTREHS
jgi:hypothetical protein